MRKQRIALEHHAERRAVRPARSVMSTPSLIKRPVGRRHEAGKDHQESGLAGTGRAEKRQELAAADVEREIVQRMERAKGLANPDQP